MSFAQQAPDGTPGHPGAMTEPTSDGRSGRAAASCVFWMDAATTTFSTIAEDHGNCSVGRWVLGYARPEDILDKADVGALVGSGWVSMDDFGGITAMAQPAPTIVYGPLGAAGITPDVVLLRLNPAQMMQFADACPQVEYSGKPQCQIIAKAREHGTIAVSMGCALSRERTGMSDGELTCAVPSALLPDIVERLRDVVRIDATVRSYAVEEMTATN
jgi:uncharacterized protein (DUF169 family)